MNEASHKLEAAIKVLIIDALQLEDIQPEDIDTDAPLFGEGLGLDSIDALELGVALKKHFGLTLASNDPAIKEHFRSVGSLAQLIANQRANQA
ncbi:MAG: phosphopantetheine-binding protein [Pseudomonadota bacterium]|nr:phosphopantetheine-binding protein [Pseudomonadota bacterium]MDP1903240.1 phosphopantetheine-binding protein [Pseudomonadota bacterium]MDP2352749.1 phosphopantetheine-binding protein [Pseudomonadota bacterium]